MNYPIQMGVGLLDFSRWLATHAFSQIVMITDDVVKDLYGLKLAEALKKAGHQCLLLSFPAGEKHKHYRTKNTLDNALLLHQCDRQTLILALGGGVVGDIAGFVAATYLRGVPYLQLPTTLLAMVDSSVGGKTAINSPYGKNMIGLIYQPVGVVMDMGLLKTLPQKHLINGLIEAIKMCLTHDAESFFYIQSHLPDILQGQEVILKDVVQRAVNIKTAVVLRDEKEQGERSLLNFGHTIGHALEKISNYTLLHGYAVAYGMLVEAQISYLLGYLDSVQLNIIQDLMSLLGIQGKALKKFTITDVLQATQHDKKTRLGSVHYTLLQTIGRAYIRQDNYTHPVTDECVHQAFTEVAYGR